MFILILVVMSVKIVQVSSGGKESSSVISSREKRFYLLIRSIDMSWQLLTKTDIFSVTDIYLCAGWRVLFHDSRKCLAITRLDRLSTSLKIFYSAGPLRTRRQFTFWFSGRFCASRPVEVFRRPPVDDFLPEPFDK